MMPQLILFVVTRWTATAAVRVLVQFVWWRLPSLHPRLRALAAPVKRGGKKMVTAGVASACVFYATDMYSNSDLVMECEPHSVPRPMGIAAGVGLVCLLFTSRIAVSALSTVTLLCVKDRNVLAGLAVLATVVEWGGYYYASVSMFVPIALFAGWHATFCTMASSAALSVATMTVVVLRVAVMGCFYFLRGIMVGFLGFRGYEDDHMD